ncbi:MAG TPA: DegT/DnrJ/EryC1/StrS family aminotransferase [Prolixibacteraceae bacterium]|nr:DegT/DnrJ/EryC1/StrS family aminotransferase [Prolixibacteraceae bacterium]HOR99159.1 DegT/DnrJ/EryC1/StrS family aminotransferase [Prolixibacteraceae bacterium]HOS90783.1 DegT/DnrJ/EryC1/StrS family aminotransferase [Prolixibacteraceae bacterium]HPL44075.1 DegT/DnrJ/EryC1/StrS family aminotransferase [Prolixibacteraceae bacterium]HQJ84311.1 DegT/DnrJ/EryC1/StrS family aminotransferase [Prolixibacteraceae bacterium]
MGKAMNIQMADLYGQYLNIKEEVDAAMAEVIRSTIFIKGGKVTEFERHLSEYQQSEVVACGNGTDALQIAFMALGLEPGDEVITTPFTFVATAEVLALLGLKPVFADVDPGDFNLSPAQTAAAITAHTRALLPVHLFGQNAPMEELLTLAGKHGLHVVEDAAQSLGSDYRFSNGEVRRSGTLGIIGCTSFFPSKTLGAFGDGGALFSRDREMAAQIRSIANHGQRVRYHYERIGMNSRLDSLQAAILDVKLRHLDEYVAARQKAADYYDHHLEGVGDLLLPERRPWSTHSFHQYTLLTARRDDLQQFLKERGVPSMVYYPKPLHLHEAYHYLGYGPGDFPVSEKLARTVLSLPMHTELDEEQLEYITATIRNFYEF